MAQNPLADLKDIHLPEPIGWWPPAPGWWLLVALVIGLGLLARYYYQRYQRNAYRRHALALLEQFQTQWQADGNDQQMLENLSTLLKRLALTVYPPQQVADLYGEAWMHFLNQQTPSPCFAAPLVEAISTQRYQPNNKINISAFADACRQWIIQHRATPNRVTPRGQAR